LQRQIALTSKLKTMVNRWNSLDQETVDVGSINSFKAGLIKLEKQGWVFYGFCMAAKP